MQTWFYREHILWNIYHKISTILNTNKAWYHTPGSNQNNIIANVNILAESKDIIHKEILKLLDAGKSPKSIKVKMLKVQKTIIKAALTI